MLLLVQLFFAFIFPTIIYGLECDVGGKCYGLGAISPKSIYENKKECNDACVYFKCIVWDYGLNVMEGAGCLEDFLNVCKWTPTKFKDLIKENLKHSAIINEFLIFYSCTDENDCAITIPLMDHSANEEIFGSKSVQLQYRGNEKCEYDDTPKHVISNPKCSRTIICEPASMYERETPEDQAFGNDEVCEACLDFECTNDGGNTVISGNGCWDDFVHACPSVPANVKEKIKENIKDAFYYDDNYLVTSCSDNETIINCNNKYIYSNYWLKETFDANLNSSYTEFCRNATLPVRNKMLL